MTVIQPRRTRRTHSEAFKQSLIEACGGPGASVAGLALANGINANQLRRWMRERGIEPPELSCLPLRVAASEPMGGFVPVQLSLRVDPPKRAAQIMSLIQSARLNGREPYAYLKDVLTRLPTQPQSPIGELLPHRRRPDSA